jgi:type VI protein secretion system component Hcp
MARSTTKTQKARKLNKGKKIEATKPLSITKTVDIASPTFFQNAVSGQSYSSTTPNK